MAMRYFKKLGAYPVQLSTGGQIKFTSLDHGLTGYFATDQPNLHAEFELCMVEQRSAITEISAEEFTRDYLEVKKNPRGYKQPWREELANNQMRVSESTLKDRLDKAQSVAGVDKSDLAPKPVPVAVAEVNKEIAANLPQPQDFTPPVGRRKKNNANVPKT